MDKGTRNCRQEGDWVRSRGIEERERGGKLGKDWTRELETESRLDSGTGNLVSDGQGDVELQMGLGKS